MSAQSNDQRDSSRKPPIVYPPFLPEEERYQRDPNTVTQRTENAIERVWDHVHHLADSIDVVDGLLEPEQRGLMNYIRQDATEAQRNLTLLITYAREMMTLNRQLSDQRQTARANYDKGWREALDEVMLHLHPDDQATLQRALDGFAPPDPEPDWDDLPF